jgi:DNA polymerase III epsilon subunit-like protein
MADVHHEYAVVDVETTGVYFRKNRVVSVAVARCDASGVILDEWYSLVNPGCPMDATHIHGITDEAVADAPHFDAIADELLGLLGGAVLIGHHVCHPRPPRDLVPRRWRSPPQRAAHPRVHRCGR